MSQLDQAIERMEKELLRLIDMTQSFVPEVRHDAKVQTKETTVDFLQYLLVGKRLVLERGRAPSTRHKKGALLCPLDHGEMTETVRVSRDLRNNLVAVTTEDAGGGEPWLHSEAFAWDPLPRKLSTRCDVCPTRCAAADVKTLEGHVVRLSLALRGHSAPGPTHGRSPSVDHILHLVRNAAVSAAEVAMLMRCLQDLWRVGYCDTEVNFVAADGVVDAQREFMRWCRGQNEDATATAGLRTIVCNWVNTGALSKVRDRQGLAKFLMFFFKEIIFVSCCL